MAIYKNNKGTWYVMIRYQDWTGARKQKCKRGFATRKEAADWELQFKLQKKASLDMTMESFCALYEEDVRPSLKQSTWLTKENIIQKKILPYLGQRKVSEITAKEIFKSGINIGRDMIGTMSNTLILAYVGGSLGLVMIIYAYSYQMHQIMNMYSIAIEIMRGVAGTIGIILTVPITSLIMSVLLTREKSSVGK